MPSGTRMLPAIAEIMPWVLVMLPLKLETANSGEAARIAHIRRERCPRGLFAAVMVPLLTIPPANVSTE